MKQFQVVFILINTWITIQAARLTIQGELDLGPDWNYKYKIKRLKHDSAEKDTTISKENTEKEAISFKETSERYPTRSKEIEEKNATRNKESAEKHSTRIKETAEKGGSKGQEALDKYATKDKEPLENDATRNKKVVEKDIIRSKEAAEKDGTRTKSKEKPKEIVFEPHKVRHDDKLRKFTVHLYRQNLKLFDGLKNKVSERLIKEKINMMSRGYRQRFSDYLNETQDQKIKTNLGTQKVVLNTMQTSQRILDTLITHLLADVEHSKYLRHGTINNLIKNEVQREKEIEQQIACKKFEVCRVGKSFSNFIADMLTEILKCDDGKLKVAMDALTEVIKPMDLSTVLSPKTQKSYKRGIDILETSNTKVLRALISIMRNILVNRNQPFQVMEVTNTEIINKTATLLEIIDIVDSRVVANEENKLEWDDLINSFIEWREGRRVDIQDIMEALKKYLDTKVLENLTDEEEITIKTKVDMILDGNMWGEPQ